MEHVWPEWLRKVMPDIGTGQHIFGLTGDAASWMIQRRPPFTRRVKIVCATCNNEWMAQLEDAAAPLLAPMITGQRQVTLGHADQATVAFWIAKTAMTLQLSHPTRRPDAIPPAHYRELHAQRRPPQTLQIWIGACVDEDRPASVPEPMVARCRITPLRNFRGDDLPTEQATLPAYAITLTLGNLVMQLFGHQYEGSRSRMRYEGGMGEALSQIWPVVSATVEWPGKFKLGFVGVDELTRLYERWM
jgi:hypothetical protein